MRILFQNEATNSGNIGGYKNTPYTGEMPLKTKNNQREQGSYKDWKTALCKLQESFEVYAESWGISSEQVVELAALHILQSPKWNFDEWLQNEQLTGTQLQENEDRFKRYIADYVIPTIQTVAEEGWNPTDIANIIDSNKLVQRAVDSIQNKLAGASSRLTEGFLTDLVNLASNKADAPVSDEDKPANSVLEQYIKPKTLNDLYKGVLYQLKTNGTPTIKENVIPIFYGTFSNRKDVAGVDDDVIRAYKQKFENAIGKFLSEDAMSICQKVQKIFESADQTPTSNEYFATILAYAVKGDEYPLQKDLEAIYKEFEETVKEDTGSAVSTAKSTRNDAPQLTDLFNKLCQRNSNYTPDQIDAALTQFLISNDTANAVLRQLLSTGGAK